MVAAKTAFRGQVKNHTRLKNILYCIKLPLLSISGNRADENASTTTG